MLGSYTLQTETRYIREIRTQRGCQQAGDKERWITETTQQRAIRPPPRAAIYSASIDTIHGMYI